jgi:hypothetical protein
MLLNKLQINKEMIRSTSFFHYEALIKVKLHIEWFTLSGSNYSSTKHSSIGPCWSYFIQKTFGPHPLRNFCCGSQEIAGFMEVLGAYREPSLLEN